MKIKIGFMAMLAFLAYLISSPLLALGGILAAILHELGHIGMAALLRIPFRELKITPFGASLSPLSFLGGYLDELLIAIGGPMINLLCVILLGPWVRSQEGFLFYFLLSSLFFLILNLLPASGFDGGRILSCLLCRFLPPTIADRVLGITSFLVNFSLWIFSAYLLIRSGSSLSLFVFSCMLFSKLFMEPQKIFYGTRIK